MRNVLSLTIAVTAAVSALTGSALTGCRNNVGDEGWFANAGEVPFGVEEQAMTNQCAAGSTVKGIDVSYYQGAINWTAVKNDGVKYAFIRVSDGLGYRDSQFDRNWREAKQAGVIRGAYQFFRSDEDAVAQADLLISKIGGSLGVGDLPPVIDVESTDGRSASQVAAKVRAWSDRIEAKLHVKPIIYTGPYFWRDSVNGADMNDHKLWVAHYGTNCPLVPPTWTKWTWHQYTSSGSVNGIGGNVDMNRFNGSLTQLKALTFKGNLPAECVSGNFDGEYCDDDRAGNEEAHDRLKNELGVNFHCADKDGEPAFCPTSEATRAQTVFVLGRAADVPLPASLPNAFRDDNGHTYEKDLNAAKKWGVLQGNADREVNPDGKVTRHTLAVILTRIYKLPATSQDYFFDDDGDAGESYNNRVAAAGLMNGSHVDGRQRNKFDGAKKITRDTLAVVAVRAFERGLVPVWKIPTECLEGGFEGLFCDDDNHGGVNDDRLNTELGVAFNCGELAGKPAFCPAKQANRSQMVYVLGKAAGIPLVPTDFFDDDDGDAHEAYLNAAKALGIITGYNGGTLAKPKDGATRDMLSMVLAKMYALPASDVDAFSDDDGTSMEPWHNKVAAAGLMVGYDDGSGGKQFKGDKPATRSQLATIAVRAADASLVPVWLQ